MSKHFAGSKVISMKTIAKAVDGDYILKGTKMWIINVQPESDRFSQPRITDLQ